MTLKFGFILTLLTVLTAPAQEYRLELKESGQQIDWRLGEPRSFELSLQGLVVNNDGDSGIYTMNFGEFTEIQLGDPSLKTGSL